MNYQILISVLFFRFEPQLPFLTVRFEPDYLQYHEVLQLTYPWRVSHEVDVKQKHEPPEESQPFPEPQQQCKEITYILHSIPTEYVCAMCKQRSVNCVFHPSAPHLA